MTPIGQEHKLSWTAAKNDCNLFTRSKMSLQFSEIDSGPDQPSNPTPTPRNRYDVPFTHNDQLKQLDRYDKLLAFIVACKLALTDVYINL